MEYNMIGWFEIPVTQMERAKKFYDTVFDIDIALHDLNGFQMGWFPYAAGKSGASGSLVKHEMYESSEKAGPLIYFTCKDVSKPLAKVEQAGGKVIQPKKEIGGGHGFMALFLDTEGNRLALHSQQ